MITFNECLEITAMSNGHESAFNLINFGNRPIIHTAYRQAAYMYAKELAIEFSNYIEENHYAQDDTLLWYDVLADANARMHYSDQGFFEKFKKEKGIV